MNKDLILLLVCFIVILIRFTYENIKTKLAGANHEMFIITITYVRTQYK